jgi:hypothetical protein
MPSAGITWPLASVYLPTVDFRVFLWNNSYFQVLSLLIDKTLSTNTNVNHSITNFITRWKACGASERSNYQLFLTEFCELLGGEKPQPATDKVHEADYTFERPVEFDDGEGKKTTHFIDLYKQ